MRPIRTIVVTLAVVIAGITLAPMSAHAAEPPDAPAPRVSLLPVVCHYENDLVTVIDLMDPVLVVTTAPDSVPFGGSAPLGLGVRVNLHGNFAGSPFSSTIEVTGTGEFTSGTIYDVRPFVFQPVGLPGTRSEMSLTRVNVQIHSQLGFDIRYLCDVPPTTIFSVTVGPRADGGAPADQVVIHVLDARTQQPVYDAAGFVDGDISRVGDSRGEAREVWGHLTLPGPTGQPATVTLLSGRAPGVPSPDPPWPNRTVLTVSDPAAGIDIAAFSSRFIHGYGVTAQGSAVGMNAVDGRPVLVIWAIRDLV